MYTKKKEKEKEKAYRLRDYLETNELYHKRG